ncbi:ABC transporter substrate-binding protein [Rathayibacter soli]|uniref:ABC transporter substrate-binding protein n=1 Tax=Rathayibacter soli TaxID=3144168 RepID=UPI0027E59B43|nr:extracellular solute-binding protein [Glaciibacter superstes]
MRKSRSHRIILVTAIALTAVTSLAACSSGSPGSSSSTGSGASGTDPSQFTVMTANENPQLAKDLDALASGSCKAENKALPIKHETVAQANAVQKITLLASQGAMPTHTIAGTAMIRPDGDLGKAGLVENLQKALKSSGALKYVLPGAISTEQDVYGGFVSMPYQYNIEGIWYNKKIFSDNDITVPKTWNQLVSDSAKLQKAGITPMTEDGKDGWPLTRIIGMYIYRNVGKNAMTAIQNGDAKLTDAAYVAGASALADYAAKGYFGEGVTSRDTDASNNMFLTGQAAMTYNGSWMLTSVNDPSQNKIGASNVGFMPFPAVTGGKGSINDYPANAGAPMVFNAKQYGPKVSDWVDCIAKNYGAQALKDSGIISGFTVNKKVAGVSPNTAEIQKTVSKVTSTVLWFEALFDAKSTSLAQSNASLLVTGQLSPQDYMQQLQSSLDANKQ